MNLWSCSKLRIVVGNPLLHELPKLLGLLQQLPQLRLRRHIRHVIVEHVPLAAAGLEVACQWRNAPPNRQL
jgi:hypothetical protein